MVGVSNDDVSGGGGGIGGAGAGPEVGNTGSGGGVGGVGSGAGAEDGGSGRRVGDWSAGRWVRGVSRRGHGDTGGGRDLGGADRAGDAQVAAIVGELATTEDAAPQRLKSLLSRLAGVLRRGIAGGGRGAQLTGQWLVDQVLAMAPRLPVRDLATLRRQHPGLSAPLPQGAGPARQLARPPLP